MPPVNETTITTTFWINGQVKVSTEGPPGPGSIYLLTVLGTPIQEVTFTAAQLSVLSETLTEVLV